MNGSMPSTGSIKSVYLVSASLLLTSMLFILERASENWLGAETGLGQFVFLAGSLAISSAGLVFTELVRRSAGKMKWKKMEAEVSRRISGDGGLAVHYQPIVDARSGRTVSCEALLRVRSPDGKLSAPTEFLSAAGKFGLLGDVACKVIDCIDRDVGRFGFRVPITVNLSLADLSDESVVRRLLAPRPYRLNIEVTETAFLGGNEQAIRTLETIRGRGTKVYLDDFGTGYSSFVHLAEMPIDVIKIDREFIRKSRLSAKHAHVCQSIVELAKNIGARSVAEGVETWEEADFLSNIGCDFIQGYFHYRPMAPESLAASIGLPEPAARPDRARPAELEIAFGECLAPAAA